MPNKLHPAARLLSLVLLLGLSLFAQASPDIQHWTTRNGAQVYFVEAPQLPMVDIRLVFDAGSARDGDRPGLAVFTNAMLEEGAGTLDADAIAEQFESLGAKFSNDAARDMGIISLRSLTKPELLYPALGLTASILTEPTFPADALERVRQQMLTNLKYEEQSPGDVTSKAFMQALYGNHPYAIPSNGTRASLQAIGREDLMQFYRQYYVARNAVIAIVGAVSRRHAEEIAETLVDHLPPGSHAPDLPAVAELERAERIHIDFPSTQTHIRAGQPGIYRGDPDYLPLYIGNHILGGSGLVSRITDEVREKRGLAYSAYSYFSPMRRPGPFVLGLQTKNESADEALAVLRDTLQRFIDEGPSKAELDAAKKNITGGFPMDIDANSDIVAYLGMIGFYGLPLDYLDTFIDRVNAVTVEQVRDAFKRRLHPEKMVTVTVGKG